MNDTHITIVGNLTADPELRFTASSKGVASFSVAVTPRTFDKSTNTWTDSTTSFYRVSAWQKLGENIADALRKGDRVIVQGFLAQKTWEDSDGNSRQSYEVTASAVGKDLRFSQAKTTTAEPVKDAAKRTTKRAAV
jgi:single-strand DNA-binding protein